MVSTVFGRSKNGGYAEAMVYGADHNASVSSNSWVYGSPGVYDPALLAAMGFVAVLGREWMGLDKWLTPNVTHDLGKLLPSRVQK